MPLFYYVDNPDDPVFPCNPPRPTICCIPPFQTEFSVITVAVVVDRDDLAADLASALCKTCQSRSLTAERVLDITHLLGLTSKVSLDTRRAEQDEIPNHELC
jgi:hypothetical protein